MVSDILGLGEGGQRIDKTEELDLQRAMVHAEAQEVVIEPSARQGLRGELLRPRKNFPAPLLGAVLDGRGGDGHCRLTTHCYWS